MCMFIRSKPHVCISCVGWCQLCSSLAQSLSWLPNRTTENTRHFEGEENLCSWNKANFMSCRTSRALVPQLFRISHETLNVYVVTSPGRIKWVLNLLQEGVGKYSRNLMVRFGFVWSQEHFFPAGSFFPCCFKNLSFQCFIFRDQLALYLDQDFISFACFCFYKRPYKVRWNSWVARVY